MSERITDGALSDLMLELPANPDRFYGSELVLDLVAELLALRAEVERLRVVEHAARAHLDNTEWRLLCHGCNVFYHDRGHAPGCT